MTLLNGLLAFGAAAFTIPLIIHLLHRSRYRTVDWGAMHLLKSSRNHNSRRMQWQQLLLLLLRCALPILLALAMARPLLQSFLSEDGQSAMSMAIVLDDSMSMFATDQPDAKAAGKTRFSVACQSAAEILRELPAGSNCIVLLGGTKPEALTGQVPDELASSLVEVGKRSIPAGEFNWEESIQTSLQWLATSQHPRRHLVLISDFQKHEWTSILSTPPERSDYGPIRPEVSFLSVSPMTESTTLSQPLNLSVHAVDVTPSILTVERPASIRTTLGNHGATQSDGVVVAVFADDVEIDRQEVFLAATSTTQIRSRWSPQQTGDHVIRVQILRDDQLIADNHFSTSAIVQDPIPILLVDGDRRNETMQSETDFLRLAFSPFSLLTGEKGDVFLSKTITPEELSESILKIYRTVCLCNVREVNDVQQKWLHDYVEQGNGLIVFLGDKVRTEQYQTWPTLSNNGLRIANYATRMKVPSVPTEGPDSQFSSGDVALRDGGRIKTQKIEFLPLRELSAASLNSLASVRFEYRTPLDLDPTTLIQPSDASVAVRFEDDQAWILEARIGKGKCLWINTACDDDDSNLPTRSIYVPLIQKLAAFVCNAEPPDTTVVASELWTRTIHAPKWDPEGTTRQVRVTKPDGQVVTEPLASDGIMQFNDTRLLGPYFATLVDNRPNVSSNENRRNLSLEPMVVCARSKDWRSSQESNLTYLTPGEMAKLTASCDATSSVSARELLSTFRLNWHGREVWTWIWTVLVLCFLAEMGLEQSLSPRLKSKPVPVTRQSVRGSMS